MLITYLHTGTSINIKMMLLVKLLKWLFNLQQVDHVPTAKQKRDQYLNRVSTKRSSKKKYDKTRENRTKSRLKHHL